MFSTFHGIEVGKKGLQASTTGLDTIGHNLSNVATEGYSRQNVTMESYVPLFEPTAHSRSQTAGQVGSGVVVSDISRIRDNAIDTQINAEMGTLGFWDTRQEYLEQIEVIYGEPGDSNLRTAMDEYWESWLSVSTDPTESAYRVELVQRAQSVTDTVNNMYEQLSELRSSADLLVGQKVAEINGIAQELAALNVQIVQSEALGDNPNDLYDRRNLLLDDLSEQVNTKVEWNNNEVIVYIGSENLVQGGEYNPLEAVGDPDNEGLFEVVWEDGRTVELNSGELLGTMTARDEDIGGAIHDLDALTINFVSATNEIHRDGFGLNGSTDLNFFEERVLSPYANGNYDYNGDGEADGSAIFKVSGTQSIEGSDLIGTNGELNLGASRQDGEDVTIAYTATDTVQNVIDRINDSDADVNAYLNSAGQLSLKATYPEDDRFPEFTLRHIEDSGNFLVGISGLLNQSGAGGAFDYGNINAVNQFSSPTESIDFTPALHPAAYFAVNEDILADSDNVAAAGAIDTTGDGDPDDITGLGDNTTALLMSDLRYSELAVESEATVGEFWQAMVADVGTKAATASTNVDASEAVVTSLQASREEYSGVSVDEEITKMLMYQHGYNASARLVTTINGMLETLMSMGA